MLLLKRLLTVIFFFPFLTVVFCFGSLVVGGAIVGGQAAAEKHAVGFEAGQAVGKQAGEQFGRKYAGIILEVSVVASLVISLGISFSGILPWCRQDVQPPPLYR